MSTSRLENIRKIVEKSPNDPFPRYGLAMELKNAGLHDEAHAAFEELEGRHPTYVAQYLMHGNLLVAMQRLEDARRCFERGIEASVKAGNGHARGELEQALAQLSD